MEDLLNHGSGSEAAPMQHSLGISGRVQTAAELCHRMVDFCQRLTTAKRKILEDPDLYPEVIFSRLSLAFRTDNDNIYSLYCSILDMPCQTVMPLGWTKKCDDEEFVRN